MSKKIKAVKEYRKDLPLEENEEKGVLQSYTGYDENGNILIEIKYSDDGIVEDKFENVFDGQSRLIQEVIYYGEDEIAEKRLHKRRDDGKITETLIYYQDGSVDTVKFEYDDSGKLLKKSTVNDDGEVEEEEIHKYNGDKLVELSRKEFGERVYSEEFEYNDDGTVTQTVYEGDDNAKTVNLFNEKGNLKVRVRYDDNGKPVFKSSSFYDEKDNLIKVIEETPYGTDTTIFEYDGKGNVIKQVQTSGNGEINHKIERKFDGQGNIVSSGVYINGQNIEPDVNYVIEFEYEYF